MCCVTETIHNTKAFSMGFPVPKLSGEEGVGGKF